MTLNQLLNADGATVGYFTADAAGRAAMLAARVEWDIYHERIEGCRDPQGNRCRSIATPIKPLELDDVEPGNGNREDYCYDLSWREVMYQASTFMVLGAASVDVRRHEINRYRRPGKSNRSADLGGPAEAAGVLYVLIVKAPK